MESVDATMREAVGDALDRLCFLADAVLAKPDEDLEAASRRGLGRMLEDIAVTLAEAGFTHHGAESGMLKNVENPTAEKPKEEGQC